MKREQYADRRVIDLSKKKTDSEWLGTIDRFYLEFTPFWFRLVGWTSVSGVLLAVAELTENFVFHGVYAISVLLMFGYLASSIMSMEIRGYPFITTRRAESILSVLIAFLLLFLSQYLVIVIVDILADISL